MNRLPVHQKSFLTTCKDAINAPVRKLNAFILSMTAAFIATVPAFCGPDAVDMDTLYENIIELICTLARYVGGVMLAYGIWQLIGAIREQNGEAQTRAVTFTFSGVALIALKSLLDAVGVI